MNKYPKLLQISDYDCGLISVQSMLLYHDIQVNYKTLKEQLRTTRSRGTNIHKMKNVFERYGLECDIKRTTIEEIIKRVPVIVPIQEKKEGHYITVIGEDDGWLRIQDPLCYWSYQIDPDKFMEDWYDYDEERVYVNYGVFVRG